MPLTAFSVALLNITTISAIFLHTFVVTITTKQGATLNIKASAPVKATTVISETAALQSPALVSHQ